MYISYYRQQCPAGSIPYTVRSGDTLYKIAELFSSNIQSIINVNQVTNPNHLIVGQRLCIPQAPNIFPACPTTNYYVVKKGDTFASIAEYFEIPYDAIMQANLGVAPEDLYEDMFIAIPVAPSPVSISINTAACNLLLHHHGSLMRTYDIGVGKPSTPTPLGKFRITYKQIEPGGIYGSRLMASSVAGARIHGTNNPSIVGTASTNGSILMHNTSINELFNFTPVGTEVEIV